MSGRVSDASSPGSRSGSPGSLTLAQRGAGRGAAARTPPTPDVRLYHRAVVVAQEATGSLRGLVRQLSIDQFENEGRRVSMGTESASKPPRSPLFERPSMDQGSVHKARPRLCPCLPCLRIALGQRLGPVLLRTAQRCSPGADQPAHAAQLVLREFLNPRQWKPPEDRTFALDAEQISALCDEAERIFRDEPSVLRLRGARPPRLPTVLAVPGPGWPVMRTRPGVQMV